jgi:hypothetical protein
MRLSPEDSQQADYVVIIFFRGRATANDPVEQIGVGAIEQRFEAVELRAVEAYETGVGESAEDEINLKRPAMPGPKQETPAANVVVLEAVGNAAKLAHGSGFPSSNLHH